MLVAPLHMCIMVTACQDSTIEWTAGPNSFSTELVSNGSATHRSVVGSNGFRGCGCCWEESLPQVLKPYMTVLVWGGYPWSAWSWTVTRASYGIVTLLQSTYRRLVNVECSDNLSCPQTCLQHPKGPISVMLTHSWHDVTEHLGVLFSGFL